MKNKLLCFIIFSIYLTSASFAQTDSTLQNHLAVSGITGLNISQLALSNWTQGGVNSITWTLTGNFGLKFTSNNWTFINSLKIAYGRTKLGGNDFQTNDNDFYWESVISKSIGWAVDPFVSNIIRTTLTAGYLYSSTPPREIADFFDPGYVTQSLGFTYDKLSNFSTRLGVGVQEVFTNKHRQYTGDTSSANVKAFKIDDGIQSVTSGKLEFAKNLLLLSSLTLYGRFESFNVWDVRWDNSIVAKVNDWLNVNLTFLLIYQKDQSATTQMKQALQLGLVYALF